MGWKWEVNAWVEFSHGYDWTQVYGGQSLLQAIKAMRKAKKVSGCVKLEWRG